MLFCLRQLPLNINQKVEFSYHLSDGERLLSAVAGVESFLVVKPLDLHYTTFSVLPGLFKV